MAPRSGSLKLVDTEGKNPFAGPTDVEVPHEETPGVSLDDGVLSVEQPDGGVVIDFNPDLSDPNKDGGEDFYANLANKIPDAKLTAIATDLIEGITRDEDSRKEWMATRARGITLLGLKLEQPTSGTGEATAPLDGMSRVHHPLLLEATIRFQATARGELLPASGPIKIRNDNTLAPKPATPMPPVAPPPPSPQQDLGMVPEGMPAPGQPQGMPAPPPAPVGMGHNGGPELEEDPDELAQALEKDMNHYLTVTAKEYVPDTDRMLFYIGFGGDGFKKVFNCPLRRRPVSESVDAEDLIVSNAATALANCGRITHKIKMRPSVLKRMQIIGAYRDVDLSPPSAPQPNEVELKKAEIQGQSVRMQRPQDQDYEILETYCELDLDEFAPKDLRGEGLPLPYRVTLERESRQILSVIRNWKEEDEQALPKQFFVQFPFVRGLGFYGLGFIHILGNTTVALTALWREIIDAGMFANFPGFLYLKALGRQLTNQFRIAPGSGVGLDGAPNQDIRQMVMPLPYKEPGAAFTAFTSHLEEVGQRLGMTSETDVGEGKQDAPVGTTLALIEQATKIMDSAHKRLHAAQAEEFQLLKERFQEDPEAFWRHNKRPTKPWKKEQFLKALENHDLVPVADPNNPTSLHRIAKATAVKQLQTQSPSLYNPKAVDMRIMRIVGIDPEGLFNDTPTPDKPDPRLVAITEKARAQEATNKIQLLETQIRAASEQAQLVDKEAERAHRTRIEEMKIALAHLKIEQENIIHAHDTFRDHAQAAQDMQLKQQQHAQELHVDAAKSVQEIQTDHAKNASDIHAERTKQQHDIEMQRERHQAEMEREREAHQMKMAHERELHQQKLEAARALAKVKKAAKPKKSGGE